MKERCSLAETFDCGLEYTRCARAGECDRNHLRRACDKPATHRLDDPRGEYLQYACDEHVDELAGRLSRRPIITTY